MEKQHRKDTQYNALAGVTQRLDSLSRGYTQASQPSSRLIRVNQHSACPSAFIGLIRVNLRAVHVLPLFYWGAQFLLAGAAIGRAQFRELNSFVSVHTPVLALLGASIFPIGRCSHRAQFTELNSFVSISMSFLYRSSIFLIRRCIHRADKFLGFHHTITASTPHPPFLST